MLFFNEHYQCNSICLKVLFSFSLSTLVMAKVMSSICVDLGAHSFIPTPHPFKRTGKQLVSFFMYIVCRYPLEQGGIENRDFKNVLPWEALQRLQLPQRLSVIEFYFYDFFLPLLV